MTAGRIRRERLARDRWFRLSGGISLPHLLRSHVNSSLKRIAASKMRIPGCYLADHPRHSWWRIYVRETSPSSSRARFFLSSLVPSLTHHVFSRPHLGLEKPSFEWLNGIEVKWNAPAPCHSRSCVTSYSRKAGPERWFPATRDATMIPRWLSWLKPFWLSRGHNYAKRTEYSLLFLNDVAARGINCLYYSILSFRIVYYVFT